MEQSLVKKVFLTFKYKDILVSIKPISHKQRLVGSG